MTRKPNRVRQLTLEEQVVVAKQPTDVWLPDAAEARADEIDRLARLPARKEG